MKTAEHSAAQGVKKEEVKIGEYIEMGAGYFIQRTNGGWMGWDGGMGMPCSESEVDRLIVERRDILLYPDDNTMTDKDKILKLTMQKSLLRSSMEVCVEGFRDTQWGWDGDCGSDQWIDMLEDTISKVSKQDEAN